MPKTATRNSRNAKAPIARDLPNVTPPIRRRTVLKSSAEGTLANIGVIARPSERVRSTRAPSGNQHMRIDDVPRRRRRRGSCPPPGRSPYVTPRLDPIVRLVPENTPPPTCIHCGGPTQAGTTLTGSHHVEKCQTQWLCIKAACPGHKDGLVHRYVKGEYDRRG
jgi:hypothetical protein